MAFDLQRVLRALLFASPGSLAVKDIQTVFTRFHEEAASLPLAPADGSESADEGAAAVVPTDVPSLVTASQIREAMEAIGAQLAAADEVFRLQETHNGWRLVTSLDSAEWVRLLRNQPRPLKLTQSALETLAIIAYRQPVTRADIETIRGVSVESPLSRLLDRDLIRIAGRADLPGRPIQYGTTEGFLEFVGVRSLEELPASDVLSSREIDEWLMRDGQPQAMTDRQVGLDTEAGDEEADLELASTKIAAESTGPAVARDDAGDERSPTAAPSS
jgi:segregation and condensation protein B